MIKENGEVDWNKMLGTLNRRDEAHHREYMAWLAGGENEKARIVMGRLVGEIDESVGMFLCNFVDEPDAPGSPLTMDDLLKLTEELRGIYEKFAGVEFESIFMKQIAIRREGKA